jgi:predicted TIM-barrel fold metal-dependent hydrolase
MKRRTLLTTALAGTAAALAPPIIHAQNAANRSIIDTNIDLFRWPFRRLPLDNTDALLKKLRSLNIGQAWAGSFEGILHRDINGVNQRLADVCAKHPELKPIGSINPTLPDWKNDLRVCVDKHKMSGIRLHPNYHGYLLDDPRFTQLLKQATDSGALVQITATMEDTRTQHAMVRAPDVDLAPLAEITRKVPEARIQVLNYRPRAGMISTLSKASGISFDTARADATDGVSKLLRSLPQGRVMFGSHSPFLIPEAALIRVAESRLTDNELHAILRTNAETSLKGSA